jgi:Fe-S oxidoreductase
MDPIARTYYSIPGVALAWLLAAVAIGLFAWRIGFFVRLLRRSQPDNRFTHILARLGRVGIDVLMQPRFRDRLSMVNSIVWPVHLLIFWGFVVYAGSFGFTLLRALIPALPLPWPDELGPVALLQDLFGVLVLIALAVAAVRRFILRPPGVKQTMDAARILVLIALVMITQLGASVCTAAADGGDAWRPAGTTLASLFGAITPAAAASGKLLFWWAHLGVVLGFLAYLPYSKHFHLLVTPFTVFFSDLRPRGTLRKPAEDEDPAAVLDFRRFTWRENLSALACAECGRCDRSCPSFAAGEKLSPQNVVHALKEHLLEAGPAVLHGAATNGWKHWLGDIITPQEVWSCRTCYACTAHCPARNEHIPLLLRARRQLVAEGQVDARIQDTLMSLQRYGNSFAQSERNRAKWTKDLDARLPDARKEDVEYLWFVGDYASYDPRLQESTRALARIFQTAGISVGLLYEGERNAGNDVRRIGEEGLYEMLVEKNLAALNAARFKTIVTTDPHTYNTLRNEYPEYGGAWPVLHYSELLVQLVHSGRIRLTPNGRAPVTYHDPCYLGRYNGVYDAPREVIEATGARLREMPRNREEGFCCGAGGGSIWMEDIPGGGERPAESRVREAAALDGVHTLVTACPKDLVMFEDAVKSANLDPPPAVRDLASFVWTAMTHTTEEPAHADR